MGRRTVQADRRRALRSQDKIFTWRQQVTKKHNVGTDAFHPTIVLDLSEASSRKVAVFLHVVEVIGKWPACLRFFLLRKDGRQ